MAKDSNNTPKKTSGKGVNLLKNIAGAGAARIINLLITLAIVPLSIKTLGRDDYAIFAIVLSLSILSNFADLGLGLTLINKIAETTSDHERKVAISTVWYTLLGISAIGVSCSIIYLLYATSNQAPPNTNRLPLASALSTLIVFAAIPTGITQRILFALQHNSTANAWNTGGRLLSLLATWIAVNFDYGSLKNLILCVIAIPAAVGWLCYYWMFSNIRYKNLKPSFNYFEVSSLKSTLKFGFLFLILQITPFLESGIDNIILAINDLTSLVPALDVHWKMFGYIPALVSICAYPIWPSIATAKGSGDFLWIAKLRKIAYLLTTITASATAVIFSVFANDIVFYWTKQQMPLSVTCINGLATLAVLSSISLTQSMLMNGINAISMQVKILIPYAIVLVLVKFLLSRNYGLEAMIWAANAAYFIRIFLNEIVSRRLFHKLL